MFVSVVSLLYRNESFGVSIELKQTEELPKQFYREHILIFFPENLFLFWFVLVCFETVCFGCFTSIPKQRVSMFRLNRNNQKINRNSLIESIFCYFSEKIGLFRSSLVFVFHWRKREEEICTTCLTSFLGSNCTSTNTVPEMEVTCVCVCHRVHTQSGNGHFQAYIPSWWKNQPSLVSVGGARPSPFTISTMAYKVVVYAPAERADIFPLLLLYPYIYSVMCAL